MQHHHGLSPNKNQIKTIVLLFKIFAEDLFLFFYSQTFLSPNSKKKIKKRERVRYCWADLFSLVYLIFFLAGRNFVQYLFLISTRSPLLRILLITSIQEFPVAELKSLINEVRGDVACRSFLGATICDRFYRRIAGPCEGKSNKELKNVNYLKEPQI